LLVALSCCATDDDRQTEPVSASSTQAAVTKEVQVPDELQNAIDQDANTAAATCKALHANCSSASSCCSGHCVAGCGATQATCCVPVSHKCSSPLDCCQTGGNRLIECVSGTCQVTGGRCP
jgi:hypothetical protein